MQLRHQLYQTIESIWWCKKKPPWLLRGFCPLYQKASQYDQKNRIKAAVKPALPVISIGNITVGGSGKTPFVIWLARELKRHHFKPVILCRGDGAKHCTPQLLDDHSLATDVGDEAVLLHRMSHCRVISARDRVAASTMATGYGDVIILDDGFQYRQLQRVCDIVLIPEEGLGNGYLLPAGPLREPIRALGRANIIVRTGTTSINPVDIEAISQHQEWHWQSQTKPLSDWNQCGKEKPQSVLAVTAIARPERFTKSLQAIGVHVEDSHFFPDHYSFTSKDMHDFWQQKKTIAVTAKDAVKLLAIWPKDMPLWVLEQEFKAQEGLFEFIHQNLVGSLFDAD